MLNNTSERAQKAQGESLSTFIASLTTSGIILGLGIISYVFLRSRFPEYYRKSRYGFGLAWKPTYLLPWRLLFPLQDIPISNLDNYFFDRYLHTLVRIFVLLGFTVSPIIIPFNVVGGKGEAGGVKGLDQLSFSNVSLSHTQRYWAHLVIAILEVALVCYILWLEMREYTRIQRSSGASQQGGSLLLLSSTEKIDPQEIKQHFKKIAGEIDVITVLRDYNTLRAKLRRREELVKGLEIAETTLILRANYKKTLGYVRNEWHYQSQPLWRRYLDPRDRPLIRLAPISWLPAFSFFCSHVDAIYHLRTELVRLNLDIEWDQQHPNTFPVTNSAFIHLNKHIPITMALKAQIPPSWTLKHKTAPEDTIWHHLSISWWDQCVRTTVVYLIVTTITIGFAFPVTIIGSLSQIKYLSSTLAWLGWINKFPAWLLTIIQGVLPPILLTTITAAVPVVICLLANMQGLYSWQDVENYIQVYYFFFVFVQGFLNISISAGITTTIGELEDTIQSLPTALAQNLPKACNYFFSYILIYTITTIVSTLIQPSIVINVLIISPLLDRSPRQKWIREKAQGVQRWGTFLPIFTNIACIGLIYSVIAPLILAFSIVCFGALYPLFRAYPPTLQDPNFISNGRFYHTAIRQLITGIYFMELCLAGLFFLVRDTNGKATCTAQAILMLLSMILTALFHYFLDHENEMNKLLLLLKQLLDSLYCRSKEWPDHRARANSPRSQVLSAVELNTDQMFEDEALRSPR